MFLAARRNLSEAVAEDQCARQREQPLAQCAARFDLNTIRKMTAAGSLAWVGANFRSDPTIVQSGRRTQMGRLTINAAGESLRPSHNFSEMPIKTLILACANEWITESPPAVLWSRLFFLAAQKPSRLRLVLWPFASQQAFYQLFDTARDVVDFLEATWPTTSEDQRADFQRALMSFDERALGMALVAIPDTDLRAELLERKLAIASQRELRKPERTKFHVSSSEYDWARSNGVEVDQPPNSTLRSAIETFKSDLPGKEKPIDDFRLCSTLVTIERTIEQAQRDGADWRLMHEAWDAVAAGCDSVLQHSDFRPEYRAGPLAKTSAAANLPSPQPRAQRQRLEIELGFDVLGQPFSANCGSSGTYPSCTARTSFE